MAGKHDRNQPVASSVNKELSLGKLQQFSSEDSDESEDSSIEEEFVANDLEATKISGTNEPSKSTSTDTSPISKVETVASTTTASSATATPAATTQVKSCYGN